MKPSLGVVIVTYNRIDDARINMEIIRNLWSPYFSDIKIVHCYNGDPNWYPEKYLEDDLVRMKNSGHFLGASEMIDAGINKLEIRYPDCQYALVLSSDTWCIKPAFLAKFIERMVKKEQYLGAAVWGRANNNNPWMMGLSLDFFFVDLAWDKKYKILPLKFGEFCDKYWDALMYGSSGYELIPERLMSVRYLAAVKKYLNNENIFYSDNQLRDIAEAHLQRITEREPVHAASWARKQYWPKIGLIMHHEPGPKKKILEQLKIKAGPHLKKLVTAKNLDYYNSGFRNTYYSNGK